jgi:hypothetical protein
MRKRGQVTIFIIIGIIILFSVLAFFFLRDYVITQQIKQDEADTLELSLNAEKVKNGVNWCIDRTAKDAIITLGFYGGKKHLAESFFEEETFDANYLYYLGEKKTSSNEEMEIMLGEMIEEHLPKCFSHFEGLRKINVNEEILNTELISDSFKIEKGEVSSVVKINEGFVNFNVKWPLKLTFKEKVKEMDNFPHQLLNLDLNRMGKFVDEFMERMQQNPQFVDMFYLSEQNYSIHSSFFNNDTYVFLCEDENSIVDYAPLTFLFSVKVNSTGVLI